MKKVPKAKRYSAIANVNEIRRLFAGFSDAGASPVTGLASRFLALVAQRPSTGTSAVKPHIPGFTSVVSEPF